MRSGRRVGLVEAGLEEGDLLGQRAGALLVAGQLEGEVHHHEEQEGDGGEEEHGRLVGDPHGVGDGNQDVGEEGEEAQEEADADPEQGVLALELPPPHQAQDEQQGEGHDDHDQELGPGTHARASRTTAAAGRGRNQDDHQPQVVVDEAQAAVGGRARLPVAHVHGDLGHPEALGAGQEQRLHGLHVLGGVGAGEELQHLPVEAPEARAGVGELLAREGLDREAENTHGPGPDPAHGVGGWTSRRSGCRRPCRRRRRGRRATWRSRRGRAGRHRRTGRPGHSRCARRRGSPCAGRRRCPG